MEIKDTIEHFKRVRLARRKQRYDLARKLGFDSEFASIMAGWSENRILNFSKQHGKKQGVPNAKN